MFATAGDPIATGIVASLARPGGNVTGLSNQAPDTVGKRLELLREAVPALRRLAIMGNSGNAGIAVEMRETEAAARILGLEVTAVDIRRADDIEPAFAVPTGRVDAVYIGADPVTGINRARIHALALKARLPSTSFYREFVEAGALMSYGPKFPDLWRRAAEFVDKILRGAKPADLPIEQPTTFELVINLKTAKALGLDVPPMLLARADEVIE